MTAWHHPFLCACSPSLSLSVCLPSVSMSCCYYLRLCHDFHTLLVWMLRKYWIKGLILSFPLALILWCLAKTTITSKAFWSYQNTAILWSYKNDQEQFEILCPACLALSFPFISEAVCHFPSLGFPESFLCSLPSSNFCFLRVLAACYLFSSNTQLSLPFFLDVVFSPCVFIALV